MLSRGNGAIVKGAKKGIILGATSIVLDALTRVLKKVAEENN